LGEECLYGWRYHFARGVFVVAGDKARAWLVGLGVVGCRCPGASGDPCLQFWQYKTQCLAKPDSPLSELCPPYLTNVLGTGRVSFGLLTIVLVEASIQLYLLVSHVLVEDEGQGLVEDFGQVARELDVCSSSQRWFGLYATPLR